MSNGSLFKVYSGHCQQDGKIKQGKGQRLPPSASSLAELIPHEAHEPLKYASAAHLSEALLMLFNLDLHAGQK